MKSILFFTSDIESDNINYLKEFEDFDIKIFDTKDIEITKLFQIFIKESNGSNIFYFISDDIDFLIICFRLYNQTFHNFIYLSNSITIIPTALNLLTIKPIHEEENINKEIYVLKELPNINLNINLKKIESLNDIKTKEQTTSNFQKVFYFNNQFLITEFMNFDYKIIYLEDHIENTNLALDNFFYNLESNLIKHITFILGLPIPSEIQLNKIKQVLNRLSRYEQEKFIIYFKFILNNSNNIPMKIYLNSFLIHLEYFTSEMFDQLLEEMEINNELSPQNKYFLLWQYLKIDFTAPVKKKSDPKSLWKLYKNIYFSYKNILVKNKFIAKEERNKDLIFIFIGQFLGELHAPTKLLLERAYHLMKNFNKTVLIINTGELLTQNGFMPFFESTFANKIEFYSSINQFPYKDINIPFYQSSVNMPNEDEIKNIISIVEEYKPYFILNIGSANLTCDLCSNIITSISFPTTSDLAISESQIHINRTELTNKNLDFLKKINIDPSSIIVSHPRGETITKVSYTKKDFDLPEDKFLLSVVGNRLDEEVTEEFICMLNDTFEYNTYVVFIGKFDTYTQMCNRFPNMKRHSTFLGYQEHLYDVMKLFDLSVNPERVGGAHGAWYSMMHSIPIVTLNFGDVHTLSKGKFSDINFFNMKESIKIYIKDKDFYQKQSRLALDLFLENIDIEKEISDLLINIENNLFFK